ncbi:MAG TPA: hypothetical protein VKG22_00735 [Stellaceae bacterium]|nr:hypothetical protein [Candidatus Binataceae bacterium]HMD65160.1 hypothetical protein [Stellaceae bacterium]
MPIDVETLTIGQLENVIENHRRQRATTAPLYADALRELEKRKGKGLDFDKSLSIILEAAKERRFLSYKELADASGADWVQVHYAIGEHLWKLVEYADRKGWPLLSSIVVNKPNVTTGKMEAETLKGFIAAARLLEKPITDEEGFLKEEQERVFAWAEGQQPAKLL